jgi:hypothetical protein
VVWDKGISTEAPLDGSFATIQVSLNSRKLVQQGLSECNRFILHWVLFKG